MSKKYIQSLTRAIKPGGFRCLPKKRSSDTFKNQKKKDQPIIEFPNYEKTPKKRSSVTSLTSFKEQPEVEEFDKEKPVVIVVVVNKRGNTRNVFSENIQSAQREGQNSPLDNNSGSNRQGSCSCPPPRGATPDYVEYFQRLEELICKCAGQKGFGINSQNTSRSGNSCTQLNKSSPIVTQYPQYPISNRNYEQRNQLPQQCQQQFKQKQQCHNTPQQQYQSPHQQCHTPQQQSQRYFQSKEQSQQCNQPHLQSQQCNQPHLQSQQFYQSQQQSQQCYQPQLYQQQDQQLEQCLKEPQQLQQPQQCQNINANDINRTCPITLASPNIRSRQQSSIGLTDHEYCKFELPVCVTKSTFRRLQSAGINQTQPLDKCLDTSSQYSNEKCKLSEYDDSTRCTCKINSNSFDYCTCMEKKTKPKRKKKRKIKCKNMLGTPEKPSNRVILRDIGLPNRCCMSCRDVPCSTCGGTRCCNTGGCCDRMW